MVLERGEDLLVLKADVSKAHRRIKVAREEWKFQVAMPQNLYFGQQSGRIWHSISATVLGKDGSTGVEAPLCDIQLRLGLRLRG